MSVIGENVGSEKFLVCANAFDACPICLSVCRVVHREGCACELHEQYPIQSITRGGSEGGQKKCEATKAWAGEVETGDFWLGPGPRVQPAVWAKELAGEKVRVGPPQIGGPEESPRLLRWTSQGPSGPQGGWISLYQSQVVAPPPPPIGIGDSGTPGKMTTTVNYDTG